MHVAVIGIGLLGRAVAERLKAVGHTVTVYNRTKTKADPLGVLGIEVAASAAQAIRQADCALLFLTDAEAIRAVVLSADARSALAGRTIIQMGTISPQESREFRNTMSDLGGDYFEAPVLGSLAEATAGTLLLMIGGTQDHLQRWEPVLRSLSQAPRLVGAVGQATALKLALNQLIAAEIAAFSLSLGLIQHSGVSVDLFMSVLKESALFAPAFEKKLPRLLQRQYDHPNFSTNHLLKDVNLFLGVANENGLATRGLEGVRDILEATIARGLGAADYSAIGEEIDAQR